MLGTGVTQTNYQHTSVDDDASASPRSFSSVFGNTKPFGSRGRSTLRLLRKAVMQ